MQHEKYTREDEKMTVKIRFFARFRELLGTDILTEATAGISLTTLITTTAKKNPEG